MAKMSISKAYEILEPANEFKNKLIVLNNEIDGIINNPSKIELNRHLSFFAILDSQVITHLESLSDVAEYAGWWTKKVGKTYIVDIRNQYTKYKWELHIVANKLGININEQRSAMLLQYVSLANSFERCMNHDVCLTGAT
jgi:hypothetical protein